MKKLFFGFALALTCLVAQAQNLVTNGDFESGFTGWSKSAVSLANQDFVSIESNDTGSNHFYSGGTIGETSFLTQSINTTLGTYYDINFTLRGALLSPVATNHALVTLNNVAVFDLSNFDLGLFTPQSVRVQGLGGLTSFSLGAESNDSFVHFDNVSVSVSAVPEPQTYAMMLLGLGLIGYAMRRRQQG